MIVHFIGVSDMKIFAFNDKDISCSAVVPFGLTFYALAIHH